MVIHRKSTNIMRKCSFNYIFIKCPLFYGGRLWSLTTLSTNIWWPLVANNNHNEGGGHRYWHTHLSHQSLRGVRHSSWGCTKILPAILRTFSNKPQVNFCLILDWMYDDSWKWRTPRISLNIYYHSTPYSFVWQRHPTRRRASRLPD